MGKDSTKLACCQEEYMVYKLLVRTDLELIESARFIAPNRRECRVMLIAAAAALHLEFRHD